MLVSAMEIQIRVQIVSKVDFDSKPGIVTTRPMSGGLLPASVLSLGGTLIQVSNMLDQIHALEAD